jgi:hypothetical protein
LVCFVFVGGLCFQSSSASAGVMSGFWTRTASVADQHCMANDWTGVYNSCGTTAFQSAVYIGTAGNYHPSAQIYGDAGVRCQYWGVTGTLDWIWTNGVFGHTTDYYGGPIWASCFPDPNSTWVPSVGSLLFQITMPYGAVISNYSW